MHATIVAKVTLLLLIVILLLMIRNVFAIESQAMDRLVHCSKSVCSLETEPNRFPRLDDLWAHVRYYPSGQDHHKIRL
mgnify:CR=1 FL=1